MVDATQLRTRMRMARKRRGLSQQAVADALEVPRTAVSAMEGGSRAVSTLELAKLAELLQYSEAFFLASNEEPEAEDLIVVLHRSLPEMKQMPEVDAAVRRILDLYREGVALRRMLDRSMEPEVPSYAARLTNAGDAIRQGEAVAREERRRLGLGDAPIRDVAELISGQGIWTAATELPEALSGLFVNHSAVGLAVLVNQRHWPVRRHFSYLHEYGHALFDRSEAVATTRQDNSSQLTEIRANAFAAAFLMPRGGVAEQLAKLRKGHPSRRTRVVFDVANDSTVEAEIRERAGSQAITYQDAAFVARRFGVSFGAAVWRLKDLNRISAGKAAALIDQRAIGKRYIRLLGYRELLEADAPPDPPNGSFAANSCAWRSRHSARGRFPAVGSSRSAGRSPLTGTT